MSRPSVALGVVVDVSEGMGVNVAGGQARSCLDRAKELANELLANMTRETYKKDVVGLYACGSDESKNIEFTEYGGCANVVTSYRVGSCNREAFFCVDRDDAFAKPSNQASCDVGSGLRVAKVELDAYVGTKKYSKRIVFLTNGRGTDLVALEKALDDREYDGATRCDIVMIDSDQPKTQSNNEIDQLCAQDRMSKMGFRVFSDKAFHAENVSARSGSSGQTAAYKGLLQIGPDCEFHVQMFTKTMEKKPPSLKKASKVQMKALGEKAINDMSTCLVSRENRHVLPDDPDSCVQAEDEVDGFRFGRQSIPFEEQDMPLRVVETNKGIAALGFIKASAVPLFLSMGGCDVIQAQAGLNQSKIGLSAFIRSLNRTKRVMIARVIARAKGKTKVAALHPYVSEDGKIECFHVQYLPFEDDVRSFQFDNFVKYQPSKDQVSVMDSLVDAMYIGPPQDSNAAKVEGEPESKPSARAAGKVEKESFIPEETLNPLLERLYHQIEFKARNPEGAIVRDTEEIHALYTPDPVVLQNARAAAQQVKAAFPLKTIETDTKRPLEATTSSSKGDADTNPEGMPDTKRVKAEAKAKDAAANQIGFVGQAKSSDVQDWFASTKKVQAVGSVNPVKDYLAMNKENDSHVAAKAFSGMREQIEIILKEHGDDQVFVAKATRCLHVLRRGSVERYMVDEFNGFLRSLKEKKNTWNQFWQSIVAERIMLINSSDTEISEVSPEQAEQFLQETQIEAKLDVPVVPVVGDAAQDDDFEDFD